MNELKVFDNKEFGGIRAMQIDGQPWFVGKDVAGVLGYADTDKAIRNHVDDEDKLTRQFGGSGQKQQNSNERTMGERFVTPQQRRSMTIINESGLYSLILSSKLPKARAFKRWVTAEVIPAIRQTGGYITAGHMAGNDTDFIIKTVVSQVMAVLPAIVAETVKAVVPALQGASVIQPALPPSASVTAAMPPAEEKPKKRRINYHGKIDKLPTELRNEIIAMVFQKNYTYMQVCNYLKDEGHTVHFSSVARYAHRIMDEMNSPGDEVTVEI